MAIKPETGDKRIQVYCSKTFLKYVKNECKKRDNVSMSALFKIAVYEYLNPRVSVIREEIAAVRRIDRTPKIITSREKVNMGLLNAEFKRTNVKTLLKPPPPDKIHHIYNVCVRQDTNQNI